MRYKSYDSCNNEEKKWVRNIYKTSFPKDEKFPFWILRQCAKENNVRLDAIIAHETDTIIGMRFLVSYGSITYLMYFAVNEAYRSNGYGSSALMDLVIHADTSLLCIEKPNVGCEDIKTRRKDFYLRNGFYETGIFIEDSGVEYEFLSSSKERIITEEDLKKRYSCMTRNPLMKFIIRNTFDNNINFIG